MALCCLQQGAVISLYARVASCAGIPDSQSRASLPDTRFASLVRERMCPGKPDLERGVISRRTLVIEVLIFLVYLLYAAPIPC